MHFGRPKTVGLTKHYSAVFEDGFGREIHSVKEPRKNQDQEQRFVVTSD